MLQYLIELLAPPDSEEWINLVFILGGLILLFSANEFVRRRFHRSTGVTRKSIHISVGVFVFFSPSLFQSALIPLGFSLFAALAMIVVIRTGLMKSIHETTRFSYGIVYYPFSFFLLIVLFWNRHPEIISLSILGLALGSAAAAVVGESILSVRKFRLTSDEKSVEGSFAMFITTWAGLFSGMFFFGLQTQYTPVYLMITATMASIIATAWEALSSKGLNNITVPISISLVLYYFLVPTPMQDVLQFIIGIALSLCLAYASYTVKFLSASGSVAAFLLAVAVYGFGGWKWTLPILVFFILSSLISKAGRQKKSQFESLFDKSSTRDWGQVFANGGVAGALVYGQYFFQTVEFYPAYLGAVAAATADTWGTEIGIWFRGKTISIPCFKMVEPGTNGGISLAGFVGGTIGASIISMSSLPWVPVSWIILSITLAGLIGSIVDSYFGGKIQAVFRCATCNKNTERTYHCGMNTDFVGGVRWINNDIVNFICTVTGAVAAWAFT